MIAKDKEAEAKHDEEAQEEEAMEKELGKLAEDEKGDSPPQILEKLLDSTQQGNALK